MRLGFDYIEEYNAFVRIGPVGPGNPGKHRIETRDRSMRVPARSETKSGERRARRYFVLDALAGDKRQWFLRHLAPFLNEPGVYYVDDGFKVVPAT